MAPIGAGVTSQQVLFLVLLWVIPFALAVWFGRQKGRRGWLYGLLLGWIGVFILASLDVKPRSRSDVLKNLESFVQCPHCGLLSPAGREFCRTCNRSLAKPATGQTPQRPTSGSGWGGVRTLH